MLADKLRAALAPAPKPKASAPPTADHSGGEAPTADKKDHG
jgi:hypothetical protein